MFGLPATTTAIMVGVLGFWVIYTLVFYFSTGSWAAEDVDDLDADGDERGAA